MAEEKESLEALVGRLLRECGRTIACAESCTGGLLTSRLTDVAGSSAYIMGAVVSYTNEVKASLVGVHEATLKAFGAVSEETAREMAEGVRRAARRQKSPWGLSISPSPRRGRCTWNVIFSRACARRSSVSRQKLRSPWCGI